MAVLLLVSVCPHIGQQCVSLAAPSMHNCFSSHWCWHLDCVCSVTMLVAGVTGCEFTPSFYTPVHFECLWHFGWFFILIKWVYTVREFPSSLYFWQEMEPTLKILACHPKHGVLSQLTSFCVSYLSYLRPSGSEYSTLLHACACQTIHKADMHFPLFFSPWMGLEQPVSCPQTSCLGWVSRRFVTCFW